MLVPCQRDFLGQEVFPMFIWSVIMLLANLFTIILAKRIKMFTMGLPECIILCTNSRAKGVSCERD